MRSRNIRVFEKPYMHCYISPEGDVYHENYYRRDLYGNAEKSISYNINTDDGMKQFIEELKEAGRNERSSEIKKMFESLIK